MENALTFTELRATNVARSEEVFHPLDHWSPTDWACAMAGEAGETCNVAKKIKRLEESANYNRSLDRGHSMDANVPCSVCRGDHGCIRPMNINISRKLLLEDMAAEIADTIIYADLLAARLGIDLGQAIRDKFNLVSEKMGSERKL